MIDDASSVGGDSAAGTHDLRNRNGSGQTYEVTVAVADAGGNVTTATNQIDLQSGADSNRPGAAVRSGGGRLSSPKTNCDAPMDTSPPRARSSR